VSLNQKEILDVIVLILPNILSVELDDFPQYQLILLILDILNLIINYIFVNWLDFLALYLGFSPIYLKLEPLLNTKNLLQ
jgi:hypothetical protein